jgi:subtilisin family serine protease
MRYEGDGVTAPVLAPSHGEIARGTGRGVRIAVIDSGAHAAHPHVNGIAGGVRIRADGAVDDEWVDGIGHGTAVAAAIREKVPEADLLAVKVFDRALSSDVGVLMRGIEWAARQGCQLINLSLGTARAEHAGILAQAVAMASEAGAVIVAAGLDGERRWLPGVLPGALQVEVDWHMPRETYAVVPSSSGRVTCRASGYPRPIPGVPVERNLKGVSFAVANMTGFAARVVRPGERLALEALVERLATGGAASPFGNPTGQAWSAGSART